MKKIIQSFYGKLSAVFLFLLLVMGLAQIWITLQSSMRFVDETDQTLNRRLAKDMSADFAPVLKDSINYSAIEHMIHYMMVMNPKIEIYLLDSHGKILAFFAEPQKKVRVEQVTLEPIHQFLENTDQNLILGDDPRHIGRKKPFSVAPINIGSQINGYLYIIIGSEQYESAISMVKDSYIVQGSIQALLVVILFASIIGLILFAFLTKRLRRMTDVVNDFEKGNINRRIQVKKNDEIGQLSNAFNSMADTIVSNMEELKQTDNLRRELIANVSHDLRSPLASIQGYLETIMLKDDQLNSDERKKYMEIILNNTKMLNNLVHELFELSKLDAKQIQPKPEPFSIAELTQDVVMKFKPRADKSEVNLDAVLTKKLPQVYADIGLIERALSNLIENALRYTPSKGVVKVVLSNFNESVRVLVSDSGCGISKEELPYIFERFYRVEKSRSIEKGGTGLGLAIAQKILQLHNSDIMVESELNVGTKFYFDLQSRQMGSH